MASAGMWVSKMLRLRMRAGSAFGGVSKTFSYTFALKIYTRQICPIFSIARPIFQVFSYPRLLFWPTFHP